MKDLSYAIAPAGVALSLLFLTPQVHPKRAALSLISLYTLVKRLMTNGQLACNLLGDPLHTEQEKRMLTYPSRHSRSVATVVRFLGRQLTSPLWTAACASITLAQLLREMVALWRFSTWAT